MKKAGCIQIVGWSVHFPGHAFHETSTLCAVNLLNSFLTLSWVWAFYAVCMCVCVWGVSAAAEVKPWVGGPLWCQDWGECGYECVMANEGQCG